MNITLKTAQWTVFECEKRFRVLVADRRFGKTYLAMVELIRASWGPSVRICLHAPARSWFRRSGTSQME